MIAGRAEMNANNRLSNGIKLYFHQFIRLERFAFLSCSTIGRTYFLYANEVLNSFKSSDEISGIELVSKSVD